MNTQVFKGIRRELQKKVPGQLGSFSRAPDGFEMADVEVAVDFAQIARQLGWRAMANKSGVSKYMGGAVVVKVLRRERVAA